MAKRKRTNNVLQNITQKTKDRATLKPEVSACNPEGLTVPAPLVTSVMLLLNDNIQYKVQSCSTNYVLVLVIIHTDVRVYNCECGWNTIKLHHVSYIEIN